MPPGDSFTSEVVGHECWPLLLWDLEQLAVLGNLVQEIFDNLSFSFAKERCGLLGLPTPDWFTSWAWLGSGQGCTEGLFKLVDGVDSLLTLLLIFHVAGSKGIQGSGEKFRVDEWGESGVHGALWFDGYGG